MLRILLISNYKENKGGISIQVELLQKLLHQEELIADIFSTTGSFAKRLFLFFWKLLKSAHKYDILHIHACSYWGFYPLVLGVLVGRLRKKKIIATYHGGDAAVFFRKHPRFVRFFLKRTNVNIVLSPFIGNIFDEFGIPYIIIPNILEIKNNKHIERNEVRPRFISVRSLTPTYNISCIIKAFELVLRSYPEATLTILSDGEMRLELEQLVKEQQMQGVTFVGQVKNTDIYSYLTENDIFVSAPLIDNQPVSVLEAFSSGLLVISSNVGGVPYMVEDGRTGLLFPSDDYNALAEKMTLAVKNQEDSIKMTKNAYKELEKYNWTAIREQLLPIYNTSICQE